MAAYTEIIFLLYRVIPNKNVEILITTNHAFGLSLSSFPTIISLQFPSNLVRKQEGPITAKAQLSLVVQLLRHILVLSFFENTFYLSPLPQPASWWHVLFCFKIKSGLLLL